MGHEETLIEKRFNSTRKNSINRHQPASVSRYKSIHKDKKKTFKKYFLPKTKQKRQNDWANCN